MGRHYKRPEEISSMDDLTDREWKRINRVPVACNMVKRSSKEWHRLYQKLETVFHEIRTSGCTMQELYQYARWMLSPKSTRWLNINDLLNAIQHFKGCGLIKTDPKFIGLFGNSFFKGTILRKENCDA